MTLAVTSELIHDLVSNSHAEGMTNLAVECAIVHEDRLLLLIEPDVDFDDTWQLPQGAVWPGETLEDAVCRTLATVALSIEEMLAYVGQHDYYEEAAGEAFRVFCFAVSVTDPTSPCRFAAFGHQWTDLADLPDLPLQAELSMLLTETPVPQESSSPPLAHSLLAGASGLYADEAGTQLLVDHATWLGRSDFRERFVHRGGGACSEMAFVDWPGAIGALEAGELPCSGGEERMLRLAASLACGIAVDLRGALVGLDVANIALVSQALVHASGHDSS
jgi:ADP-ribose pyrophosphatase YjhB (NUDIX family)